MNLGSLGGLFGGDERRKKLMDGLQGVMKNPEAMKAIGGLAAGGMGGAEGAGAAAGGEGGGAGASGGFGALLGGLKTPQMGPGGTAGFNPAAADSLPKIGRPMGGDTGLINRPQPMPSVMPQLQRPDAPVFEPIRDSVNINASTGGPVGGSSTLGSMMDQMANRPAAVENQQTQMLAPRPIGEVRPPDFLGRKGATMDDTPLNHERYAYDNQYMKDGHHGRRWQDIAMTALHGANEGFKATGDWRGALSGAGTGAIGAAISPQHARDLRFDREQLPGLERSRADAERGQDRGFEMQKRNADLAGTQARTAATIAGTKDPQLERLKTESLIAKQNAQAEAIRTGKPQKFTEYDPDTQQYVQGWKYPDGRTEYGGQPGEMRIKQEGFENQRGMNDARIEGGMARTVQQGKDAYRRTQAQQSGANYRTGQTQSGQDRRQKDRLGAQYGDVYTPPRTPMGPDIPPQTTAPAVGSVPTKRATAQHVQEYAQKFGVSPEEARKRFEAKGYRVE